jgi:hypothetical protein
MFKIEQNINPKPQNRSKKAVFTNGMALANKVIVKKGITHKELTLILGIVVALVVALIFAKSASEETKTGISSGKMHIITVPNGSVKMIQSAVEILF